MRPSKKKTTLAILRTNLDLEQKEFSDVLGLPVKTLAALEQGRDRKITDRVARQVQCKTLVSLDWLKGDPVYPVRNILEQPMELEELRRLGRCLLKRVPFEPHPWATEGALHNGAYARVIVTALTFSAAEKGTWLAFGVRLREVISDLAREFDLLDSRRAAGFSQALGLLEKFKVNLFERDTRFEDLMDSAIVAEQERMFQHTFYELEQLFRKGGLQQFYEKGHYAPPKRPETIQIVKAATTLKKGKGGLKGKAKGALVLYKTAALSGKKPSEKYVPLPI
jgi:hypothetical protein